DGKRRAGENFLGQAADAAACRVQRVKEGKRICERPDRYRSPDRDGEGRLDRNWRRAGGRCLERQAVPQDVPRRTLRASFARKEDNARGAEHRNESSATLSP